MKGNWTKQDIEYLVTNRADMTVEELSVNLNRSTVSITSKIGRLGLKKGNRLKLGSKINKLTLLSQTDKNFYECICECGKTLQVHKGRFYGKETIKSCGCHKKVVPILGDIKLVTPDIYSYRYLFSRYIRNAMNDGKEFSLSIEQFIEIISKNCAHCGFEPRPFNAVIKQKKLTEDEKKEYWVNANGIDRLNSESGYIEGNVAPCCKDCNYAKRNMTLSEWNGYLNRIYKYRAQLLNLPLVASALK